MSFAASLRFRSSDRPNDVAILTIHPRRRQMSNSLLANGGAGKPRHRSQNPRGEGESAGSDRIKAFGVEDLTPLLSSAKIDIFPFAAKVRPQCSSEMNLEKFFTELKRRNVYKVAVAYAVVAWLLIQVATQVFPFFEIPNWSVRLVILLLIIGFPVTLMLAWAFDLTPEGIK